MFFHNIISPIYHSSQLSKLHANSYLDKDIEQGLKYHYIITAIFYGDESENSNEVTLPIFESNVTLVPHLLNNQIKEYEVTKDESENFLNWLNIRMSEVGVPYYEFVKKQNTAPYTTIKEYIVYDKIVWFEVREY